VAGDPVEQHDRGRRGVSPVQEMKPRSVNDERSIVVNTEL